MCESQTTYPHCCSDQTPCISAELGLSVMCCARGEKSSSVCDLLSEAELRCVAQVGLWAFLKPILLPGLLLWTACR